MDLTRFVLPFMGIFTVVVLILGQSHDKDVQSVTHLMTSLFLYSEEQSLNVVEKMKDFVQKIEKHQSPSQQYWQDFKYRVSVL